MTETVSAEERAAQVSRLLDDLINPNICRIREGDRITVKVKGKSRVYKVDKVTSPDRRASTIHLSYVEQP